MRIVVPGDPVRETGLTWEELLSRMPPFGWRGGECPAGQLLGEADLVVAVVDRIQSFPSGILIAVAFDTGDEDLASRLQGQPTREEMRAELEEMRRRSAPGTGPRGDFTIATSSRFVERRPEPAITLSVDAGGPLRILPSSDRSPSSATESLVFEHVTRRRVPPGILMSLWLRPTPEMGGQLGLSVDWPQVGLSGSVHLDMAAIRRAATSARQLYRVEWHLGGA
jgi:hypothetical protein